MDDLSRARRQLIEHVLIGSPTNDPRPVFERLAEYVKRGRELPETLSASEIRQICLALSIYLPLEGGD